MGVLYTNTGFDSFFYNIQCDSENRRPISLIHTYSYFKNERVVNGVISAWYALSQDKIFLKGIANESFCNNKNIPRKDHFRSKKKKIKINKN